MVLFTESQVRKTLHSIMGSITKNSLSQSHFRLKEAFIWMFSLSDFILGLNIKSSNTQEKVAVNKIQYDRKVPISSFYFIGHASGFYSHNHKRELPCPEYTPVQQGRTRVRISQKLGSKQDRGFYKFKISTEAIVLFSLLLTVKESFFQSMKKGKDFAIQGFLLLQTMVASDTECGLRCDQHRTCASFTVQYSESRGPKICELNKVSAKSHPRSVVRRQGFQYFERAYVLY